MNFLTIFEYKYLALTLLSVTFISGYASPYRTSKKTKNDTSTGENAYSRTVRSNKTSSHNPKKTSNFPRVELPISGAKPKPEKTKLEAARLLPTDNNCVVVFDIDNTLSIQLPGVNSTKENYYGVNYTECPRVLYTHGNGDPYLHTFLPYLHILFDYLIEHGARIAFFSITLAERNDVLIPDLLKIFWGSEKYEALRARGQFAIHSMDDARDDYGNPKKDLRVVQREGETLSEIVLVDDDHYFSSRDQRPLIRVRGLSYSWAGKVDHIVLNNVYYMLGLFKTYFENEEYRKLPIRIAMSRILPNDHYPQCSCEECSGHHFVRHMVGIGLSAVQRVVTNATLYQRQSNQFYFVDEFDFTRVL